MKKIIILLFIIISVNIYSLDINQIYNNANSLIQNGNYDGAINEYKKLLTSENNTDISNGYFYIGYCYQLKQDNNNAIKNYLKSLEYNSKNVYTMDYLGALYLNSGIDYKKGHDYLFKAYELSSSNYITYYNLSWYFISEKKDLESGIKFFELALYYNSNDTASLKQYILWPQTDKSMTLLNDSEFYKKLINNQDSLYSGIQIFYNGYYYQNNGDFVNAESEYDKAVRKLNEALSEDSFINAVIYNFAGEIYRTNKDFEKALSAQDKAKNIYEKRFPEANMLLGTTYNYLGSIYTDMEEYQQAFNLFDKSFSIYTKIYDNDNEIIAGAYYKMGESLFFLEKYKDAISYLKTSRDIREKIYDDNNKLLGESYFLLGKTYYKLDNFDDSLTYHNKSLKINLKNNNNDDIRNSYFNIAEIYEKKQEYKKAIEFSMKSFELNEQEDSENNAVDLANLGYLHMKIYEYQKSIDLLSKSLNIFKRLNINNENLANTYYNLSDAYRQNGDHTNSLKYALLCLDIREKLFDKDDDLIGDTYNMIGSDYENIYELKKADEYYQKAFKIYEINKDYFGIAVVNNNFATSYIKKGLHKEALEKINQTMIFLKKAKDVDDLVIATILNNTGLVYDMLFDYNKAIEYYNKSLDIYLNKNDDEHPGTVVIYKNLGNVYSELGYIDDALAYYNKALLIVSKYYEKDGYQTADIYNAIGVAYDSAAKYNESKEYFFKALEIFKRLSGENTVIVSIIYNNLGRMFYRIGQYEKALDYQHQSIEILEKYYNDNLFELAIPYNTIGITYAELGNFEKALFYQNKSLDIRLKIYGENHRDVAVSYNDIGLTYTYKADYKKALEYYEKSMNIKLKILEKNSPSIAVGYNNIALANSNMGNNNKAIDYYLKALNIYKISLNENHPNIALAYNNIGITYFMNKDFINAKKNLYNSIEIAEKIREELIVSSKAKSELFAKSNHTYKMMVSTLYYLNDYNEAFYYLEKSKSRSLLDDISKNIIYETPSIDEKIRKELKNQDDLINSINKSIANKRKIDLNIDEEETQLLKAEKKYYKIYNDILLKYPKIKNLTESKIYKLDEVQEKLDNNDVIIEYSIFDESYVIVILNHDKKMIKLNVDREKLFNYIEVYRELLTNRSKDFYINRETGVLYSERGLKIKKQKKDERGLKKEKLDNLENEKVIKIINDYLYKELFKPVIPFIKKDLKIKIVPDSNLSFLPFEALINEEDKYLIEIYNISYIQSCSVYLKTKEKKNLSKTNLLAFGGALYSEEKRDEELIVTLNDEQIDFYKNQYEELSVNRGDLNKLYRELGYIWENLPGTKKEVEDIGKIYYKKNSKAFRNNIILGGDVTEEKIKELNSLNILKNYKMIHFATHGLLEIEVPELSSIVLSLPLDYKNKEDGYLTLSEIMMLDINSEMIILSACETGLGKLVSGEGVVGLTQSFLIAGSKNIIVSLWKVNDDATKDFMISFYKKIKNGSAYKTALRETKIEFINGKWNKPYFWAPFVLYGE